MKDSLKIGLGIIIGALGSAACCIGMFFLFGTIILASISTQPTSTAIPTPLSTGETWVVNNLAITVLEHEISGCYTSDYGSEICPPKEQPSCGCIC